MQPEQPALRPRCQADHPVAAIADIEVAALGEAGGERRPANALVAERGAAVAACLDPMAARGERLRERDKSGFGPAERARLGHRAVEGDAVIGHDHIRHHSVSRRALR